MESLPASSACEPRRWFRGGTAYRVWLLWSAVALALTLGPLQWFLEYFAKTGPYLEYGLGVLLAALMASAWAYTRVRPKRLRGLEARLLAALALGLTLLQEPRATIAVGALVVACYGLGSAALARLGVRLETALERIALGVGAGVALWLVGLIPIGLAGFFRWEVFALLLVICLAAFRQRTVEFGRDLRSLDAAWREVAAGDAAPSGIFVVFFIAFFAAFWLTALSPTTATDPIAFHLSSARYFLQTGSLEPLPLIPGGYAGGQHLYTIGHSVGYAFYPQSFEELLAIAWGLGGMPATQLVSPLFALLTALMVGAIGRRCGLSRTATLLGIAAGFTLPVVSWNGAIAKNDAMLAFFQLGSLWAVATARGRGARSRLILAAFFLGVCFGTKHVALYGAIPIGLLILVRLFQVRRPVRLALVLGLVFALSGLSWHYRTWRATGNPLFPATVGFAGAALPVVGGSATPSTQDRVIKRLTYPWIAHFRGPLTLESPLLNPLGFYFVFFWTAWIVLRRRPKNRVERDCLIFCGLFSVYWLYTWPVLRYGAPLLLTLVMLTAQRVEGLLIAPSRWTRRVTAASLAYIFALALPAALIIEVNVHQFRYFTRRIDRQEYLRTLLDQYGPLEFLNGRMAPDQRSLSIVNCVNAYANDPSRYRCLNVGSVFGDDDEGSLREVIRLMGPDYLVLPVGEKGERAIAAVRDQGYDETIYEDEAFRIYGRR